MVGYWPRLHLGPVKELSLHQSAADRPVGPHRDGRCHVGDHDPEAARADARVVIGDEHGDGEVPAHLRTEAYPLYQVHQYPPEVDDASKDPVTYERNNELIERAKAALETQTQ